MSTPFDPVRQRELLRGEVGVEWHLAEPPVAGHVAAVANLAVTAAVAGLEDDARRLARYVVTHGRDATYKPRSGRTVLVEYHRLGDLAQRLTAVALLKWFLGEGLDGETLRQSLDARDGAIADYRTFSKERLDTMEIDAYMLSAVLAGEDARALNFFQQHDRDGAKPLEPARATSERKVAALVARSRLDGNAPDAAIVAAIDKLFKRNAGDWLSAVSLPLFGWLALKDAYRGEQRPPIDAVAELLPIITR